MLKTKKSIFVLGLIFIALLIAGLFSFYRPKETTGGILVLPTDKNVSQKMTVPDQVTTATEVTSVVTALSTADQTKWAIFEDILKTKNDNDVRLDQNLKDLSAELHSALFAKYQSLPPEDHSGRGLIVFLIARDFKSSEDIQFLKKVYEESPCLSLENCQTIGEQGDPHHQGVNQTTLVYAQLAGLYKIEKRIQEQPEILNQAQMRSGIVQVLAQATQYPVPVVRDKAQEIRAKYNL